MAQTENIDIEEYAQNVHFYTNDVPQKLLDLLSTCDWQSYLDLGCGDGALLAALNARGVFQDRVIHAADLSAKRIERVQRICPGIHCHVSDACDVANMPDSSLDFLVSTMVLEHVPDPKAMVKEICRMLVPGGTFYLTTVFKKKWALYYYRRNGEFVLDPTHLREYTSESPLLELLKDADLEVISNTKTPMWFPVLDFFLRRLNASNAYRNRALRALRRIKIPIPGYYSWEIVGRRR